MMASPVPALQFLPEEVWEVVLSQVEDSMDILNVFKAYPELNESNLLQKKKWEWLIHQVFPNVAPLLIVNEVLSCRLVSKKWSLAVDSYLENHQDQRPVDHDHQIAGQVWTPTASPKLCPFLPDHFRPITFTSVASFEEFIDTMGNHPEDRSPFVGRCVRFNFKVQDTDNCNGNPYWQMVMKLFRKFGKHIWFLDFLKTNGNHLGDKCFNSTCCHKINCNNWRHATCPIADPTALIEKTIECFSYVPNLKRLYFGNCDADIWPDIYVDPKKLESYAFPPLPQLESLELRGYNEELNKVLADKFILSYASSIRRLAIEDSYWKMEYGSLFPNLTELELPHFDEKEWLNELLRSINAKHLSSLKLNIYYSDGIFENDIVQWVRLFPRLKELSFRKDICDEMPGRCILKKSETLMITETGSIQSLKSLRLIALDLDCNYNFLQSFHALEDLKLFICQLFISEKGDEEYNPFWIQMDDWCVAENVYQHKIWKDLPKLRTLTLLKCYDVGRRSRRTHPRIEDVFSYNRFHYQSFKTNSAIALQ